MMVDMKIDIRLMIRNIKCVKKILCDWVILITTKNVQYGEMKQWRTFSLWSFLIIELKSFSNYNNGWCTPGEFEKW